MLPEIIVKDLKKKAAVKPRGVKLEGGLAGKYLLGNR